MEKKKELLRKTMRGEKTERRPASLWRHFYDQETTPEGLARAMTAFQNKFQWDFMKVNPRACYHAETFGIKYKMSVDPSKNQERIGSPFSSPRDWRTLKTLSPRDGALGEQLQALRLIKKEWGDRLTILQTVFHPFSIASDLLETPRDLIPHYQDHWKELKNGLEAITETFRGYVRTMFREELVDGIFFAIKDWGTADLMDDGTYREVARPYDLAVLEECAAGEFNILHVCKSNNRLFSFLDYPVHALNWDASDKTNPNLTNVAARTDKLIIGGMAHRGNLLSGSPEDVKKEAQDVLKETQGARFVLGAGCTVSVETPEQNLRALREMA